VADERFDKGPPRLPDDYFQVPASARIWNYWLGGKDNYQVDREAGDAYLAVYPAIRTVARQSRQFLIRSVRYLAGEAGIRQFLDIGTGLPAMQNTHEVAQSVAPGSTIVYVDNDPVVLAHARAILTNLASGFGPVDYIDADVHHPELIIAEARGLLNLDEPVSVMFFGILGHVADLGEARSIVTRVMDAMPPGSYLTIYDGTSTSAAFVEAEKTYDDTGAVPYVLRSPEQVTGFFDGLELVEPGVVSISQWRPDAADLGTPQPVDAHGAVARKCASGARE
jgi:hypothetical protein